MKKFKRVLALILIVCLLPVANVFASTGSIQVEFNNRISRNAGGIITVTTDSDDKVLFYWGDGNGGKLADHTYLGYVMTTGGTGMFEIQRYTFIPDGAKQILAFNDADGTLLATYDLPEYKIQPMGDKSYSFGAVSDAHIGHSTYPNSEGDFERAYNKMGEYGVSLIGNDGDVSSYNLINDWTLYKNKVKAFNEKYPNVACFAVTGNHDASHDDFDMTNWNRLTKDEIVNYKGYTKPEFYDGNTLDFIYRIENDVFIFLNATDWKDTAHTIDYYAHEQLEWLERRLEENKDKRCFLFMHYGPFEAHAITKTDGTLTGGTFENGDYMDVFFTMLYEKYPNVMAFFGHSHRGFNYQLAQYVKASAYSNTMNHNINNIGGATMVHIPSLTEPSYYYYDETAGAAQRSADANYLSEAYIIDVYDHCVVLHGYDFMTDEVISYADYIVELGSEFDDVEVKDELLFDNTSKTVTVKGAAGEENGNAQVVMMMTYENADIENLTKGDILYYDQQTSKADGSYCFNFKIAEEVTDEQFKVYINVNGENLSDTITETVVDTKWLDAGIEFVRQSTDNLKAVYTVKNYSNTSLDCQMVFGIYDKYGALISAKAMKKAMPKGTESERIELEIPAEANKISAYVWSGNGKLIPVCTSKKADFLAL